MQQCRTLRSFVLFWMGLTLLAAGCAGSRPPVTEAARPAAEAPPPAFSVTLLQLNDVYEITPVDGGRRGGMARVAALREALLQENPNTYTVLAGDFYGPSALGTARVDGERLAGRQMVAVLNALGLDLATFGNHEFDVSRDQFYRLLDEGAYDWVSSNVRTEAGAAFPGVPPRRIVTFTDSLGRSLRLGFFGVTLASNQVDYVAYDDPYEAAREQVRALRDSVDVVVALTHLALDQDRRLAETVPGIDLILGGHEHENIQVWRGSDFTPILKADANARSVYVHRLRVTPATGALHIDSELVPVTDRLPEDPAVRDVVQGWMDRAYAGFREGGFEPGRSVAEVLDPLDGMEASVRNRATLLTDLIAEGMMAEAPGAELALFNSGSIRIDDVLPVGPLTEYDVIRILPFGGTVLTVEMKGALLRRTLEQGLANVGSGGFLQTAGVARGPEGAWLIDGEALDPERTYTAAVNDFLVSGHETGLDFLHEGNPDLRIVGEHRDVRRVLIDELKRRYGAQ